MILRCSPLPGLTANALHAPLHQGLLMARKMHVFTPGEHGSCALFTAATFLKVAQQLVTC
jgi:hypothetical protein